MLVQLEDTAAKSDAQKTLEDTLKSSLDNQGVLNIGFPSGNVNAEIFSNGDGTLWATFQSFPNATIPRTWNAYGVFDKSSNSQTIAVEINTPTKNNSAKVAGFFAKDVASGKTYLMHDGGIGGGKKGVGKGAFVVWAKLTMDQAQRRDNSPRQGIIIGDINDKNLAGRIWKYVCCVRDFKTAVKNGIIADPTFQNALSEWEEFKDEGSGRRTGERSSAIDYFSYHGDVVRKLNEERSDQKTEGELIANSQLIDLFVKQRNRIIEVYEIKTSLDRQALYTAIGQLMTHSIDAVENVKRYLVIPEGDIPPDLQKCLDYNLIIVRRFKLYIDRESGVDVFIYE